MNLGSRPKAHGLVGGQRSGIEVESGEIAFQSGCGEREAFQLYLNWVEDGLTTDVQESRVNTEITRLSGVTKCNSHFIFHHGLQVSRVVSLFLQVKTRELVGVHGRIQLGLDMSRWAAALWMSPKCQRVNPTRLNIHMGQFCETLDYVQ